MPGTRDVAWAGDHVRIGGLGRIVAGCGEVLSTLTGEAYHAAGLFPWVMLAS